MSSVADRPPLQEPSASPDGGLSAHVAHLEERVGQLQHALDSRVVIEQAKGMLAERFMLTVDEAFELLRHASRSSRRPLRELAAAVVSSPDTPDAVESERLRRPLPRR